MANKNLAIYYTKDKNNIDECLNSISNLYVKYSHNDNLNSFCQAKEQEDLFIKKFNEKSSKIKAVSISNFLRTYKIDWNSELDSKLGDIIMMDEYNKVILHVDLKVAKDRSTKQVIVGTPTAKSLENFSNTPQSYYLCSDYDGRNIFICDAKKLTKDVLSHDVGPFMMCKYDRKKINNTFKNIQVLTPAIIKNKTADCVHDADFLTSNFVKARAEYSNVFVKSKTSSNTYIIFNS